MTSRAASADATRLELIRVADHLVSTAGIDAVTLRAVGSGAGVSRTAAYRHFADKDALLEAVAAGGWARLTAAVAAVSAGSGAPAAKLRSALAEVMRLARSKPHLYRLMLARPGNIDSAEGRASQDVFLGLVHPVTGPSQARPLAGLLLSAVHGITDLELNAFFSTGKWDATGDELIDVLVDMVVHRVATA